MLKREVGPSKIREGDAPCIHKELSNATLVTMIVVMLVFGGFFGGLIGHTRGYHDAYAQGYASKAKIKAAFEKGRHSCSP